MLQWVAALLHFLDLRQGAYRILVHSLHPTLVPDVAPRETHMHCPYRTPGGRPPGFCRSTAAACAHCALKLRHGGANYGQPRASAELWIRSVWLYTDTMIQVMRRKA